MENKKIKLEKLLQESVFVSEETKRKIQQKLDVLSDPQIDAIIDVLEMAAKSQDFAFQKIMQKDPDFLNKLDQFSAKKIREAYEKSEEESSKKEVETLSDIKKEITSA
jgi:hypothetical protein